MSLGAQAILASAFSSVVGLAGGFALLGNYNNVKRWSHFFVSFAAGALLGAAFFDVLRDALESYTNSTEFIFGWVMVGFVIMFILERFILQHHHGDEDETEHDHRHLIVLNIVGDAIHNFVDGTVIAATFLANTGIGLTTALAVFFHEIPREIGDFSIMIYAGMSRRGVAWWNVLGALVSPVAAGLTLLVADRIQTIQLPLLGIAAGNFIYIAAADLVPAISHVRGYKAFGQQLTLFVLGLLVIVWISSQFAG